MKISILTLFPEMFVGPFDHSIIKRAKEKGLVDINFINIRSFGTGKHKVVDDKPYGGGVGMVMKVDVLHMAIEAAKDSSLSPEEQKVVLFDARGRTFHQTTAQRFSKLKHIILLCGHYEGVDERIRKFVDEEISIGDYILTGGEIPAMIIVDATIRLLPNVLKEDATSYESFSFTSPQPMPAGRQGSPIKIGRKTDMLLEYPQYTTPREYKNLSIPEILLSGDHQKIAKWKQEEAEKITREHRNDLLKE